MRILPTLVLLCSPLFYLMSEGNQGARQPQEASETVGLRPRGLDGETYDIEEMRGNVLLVSSGAT